MDDRLARLIYDYKSSVRAAVVLMQRSGIQMPYSSAEWVEFDIPMHGELKGNARYFKHGVGCEIRFPMSSVDFDFGDQGEIDGFDLWRLQQFSEENFYKYGFETQGVIKQLFEEAIAAEELIYSGHILYYVAKTQRVFAIDVESRMPDDKLPGQNQDPVLVLYSHYFLTAQLMFKNYKKLDDKWMKRRNLNQNDEIDLRIYLSTWLGFLAVTCEAFQDLKMRILMQENRPEDFCELIPQCDAIGKLMNQHKHSLRELRNKTFHLREDPSVIRKFFDKDADRLTWATDLHADIARFFSAYRILCDVHYARHGRISEMRSRRTMKRKITTS
jgi:hypothetical protein